MIQVNLENDSIELDDGRQYMSIPLEDARKLIKKMEEKIQVAITEKNLKKDWNYLGGL